MNAAAVRILVTGGTFDKNYDELEGQLRFRATHVPEMLELGRSRIAVEVETLMLIDSLEMTDAHRARIVERCRVAPEARIVVTHGTDTMAETARHLLGVPGKTIVLTGAMEPARLRDTDAPFNVGTAIAAVQCLPPGVYVAMNGRVFAAETVRKNREKRRFEDDQSP
jgi:L-asparaginase